MIKSYETTYLLSSRIDESEILQTINQIKEIITSLEGKILNESQIRAVDLGYEIKNETKANLLELAYEFNGSNLEELNKKFRENKNILRYLLKEFIPRKAEPIKRRKLVEEKPQKVELEDIDKKIEEIFETDHESK